MDFTILGGVVGALLLAIPAIGAFFERSNRRTRRRNAKLTLLVQEQDIHIVFLEREGWTLDGRRPPPRPPALRAESGDDDVDQIAPGPQPRPRAPRDPDVGRGPRHAADEA